MANFLCLQMQQRKLTAIMPLSRFGEIYGRAFDKKWFYCGRRIRRGVDQGSEHFYERSLLKLMIKRRSGNTSSLFFSSSSPMVVSWMVMCQIRRVPAYPYNYYHSKLAPEYAGHKNTVETDQETSLVQAVAKYIRSTGDKSILQDTVASGTVQQHLEEAMLFLLKHRFSEKYGLDMGCTLLLTGVMYNRSTAGVWRSMRIRTRRLIFMITPCL